MTHEGFKIQQLDKNKTDKEDHHLMEQPLNIDLRSVLMKWSKFYLTPYVGNLEMSYFRLFVLNHVVKLSFYYIIKFLFYRVVLYGNVLGPLLVVL